MTRYEDTPAAASWSEHVRWGTWLREYQEKRDAERAPGVVEAGSHLPAVKAGPRRRPKARRK